MRHQKLAIYDALLTGIEALKISKNRLFLPLICLFSHLKCMTKSTLNALIFLSSSDVYKHVDKLWISCGRSCGQLELKQPLWIGVDKRNTYPQAGSIYPQFYPHTFLRQAQQKLRFSPVSTGPTIYIGFFIN